MHRVRACVVVLGCALVPAASAGLAAQPAEAPVCETGRISSIFIDNHSVFDLSDPDTDRRFRWAYRLANRMHARTREAVIRRELLFEVGDCYDPERLRESERIVRAASFIADTDIFGIRQQDGSYHVIVDTRDEWSTRVEARVGGGRSLRGLALHEDNLLGSGSELSVYWRERHDEPTYGASISTPQLFDTRWDAGLALARTPVGHLVSQSLSYPFVGDVGRWAFLQRVHHEARYFEYVIPEENDRLARLLLPERRQRMDLGAVYRLGRRGRLTLVGAAVAGERIGYPPGARYADTTGASVGLPSPDSLATGLDTVADVRALLLFGQRNVRFARRRSLDTVHGTEDVRLGLEIEAAVGHSVGGLTDDAGVSLDFGLFGALEPMPGMLAGTQVQLEAKHGAVGGPSPDALRDVFGQLTGWLYWRPADDSPHTLVATVAAAGGWHTSVPFQLTLGGASGLRGYANHLLPGARRVVVSLEQRSYLGWPFPDLFDLGAVTHLDFGVIEAGRVVAGTNSGYRASAGVGLRAAFPPGSQQTFALDVSLPVQSGAGLRSATVQIGLGQAVGMGAVRNDPQLRRSSRRGLLTSLFNFPN